MNGLLVEAGKFPVRLVVSIKDNELVGTTDNFQEFADQLPYVSAKDMYEETHGEPDGIWGVLDNHTEIVFDMDEDDCIAICETEAYAYLEAALFDRLVRDRGYVKQPRMMSDLMLFELISVVSDREYEEVGTSDFFALVKELFDVDATDLDLERYLEIDG